jgi:hypothetical protein
MTSLPVILPIDVNADARNPMAARFTCWIDVYPVAVAAGSNGCSARFRCPDATCCPCWFNRKPRFVSSPRRIASSSDSGNTSPVAAPPGTLPSKSFDVTVTAAVTGEYFNGACGPACDPHAGYGLLWLCPSARLPCIRTSPISSAHTAAVASFKTPRRNVFFFENTISLSQPFSVQK